jgi:hypothetical protein
MRMTSMIRMAAVGAVLGGAVLGAASSASADQFYISGLGCRAWYGPDATGASLAPCVAGDNTNTGVVWGAANFSGNADSVILWLGEVNSNGTISQLSNYRWSFGSCHGYCGWNGPQTSFYDIPALANMVYVEQYELGGVWHDFIESPEFYVSYEL